MFELFSWVIRENCPAIFIWIIFKRVLYLLSMGIVRDIDLDLLGGYSADIATLGSVEYQRDLSTIYSVFGLGFAYGAYKYLSTNPATYGNGIYVGALAFIKYVKESDFRYTFYPQVLNIDRWYSPYLTSRLEPLFLDIISEVYETFPFYTSSLDDIKNKLWDVIKSKLSLFPYAPATQEILDDMAFETVLYFQQNRFYMPIFNDIWINININPSYFIRYKYVCSQISYLYQSDFPNMVSALDKIIAELELDQTPNQWGYAKAYAYMTKGINYFITGERFV